MENIKKFIIKLKMKDKNILPDLKNIAASFIQI